MHVYAPDTDGKRTASSDCGCGCGCGGRCGCESRCCDLECIVRPNFFCGQLLTDGDLAATVEWARSRFSLSRYRHGWGIACGLDVTCSSPRGDRGCCDEPRGATVYVNPGYAIDCCGNDLVVCEPMPVDLTDACKAQDDPCEKPPKSNGQAVQPAPDGGDDDQREKDCWEELGRKQDLFAVTLMLRYHEDLSQPQRAMFRSGCSDAAGCEYTRVQEHPCVHVEPATLDGDCEDDRKAEEWREMFDKARAETLRGIVEAMRLGPQALLKYLRKHPPYKFCFLEDLACCLIDTYGRDAQTDSARADVRRIAYYLYFDWLLHQLECGCASCRPDKGVPIARVVLRRPRPGSSAPCRVVMIDPTPIHRRRLRRDECRPIPQGTIDLAPYLWQPETAAIDRLRAAGLNVDAGARLDEKRLYAMDETVVLEGRPQQRLRTISAADPVQCRRVVGFEVAPDL
jgi:hypothetical protein